MRDVNRDNTQKAIFCNMRYNMRLLFLGVEQINEQIGMLNCSELMLSLKCMHSDPGLAYLLLIAQRASLRYIEARPTSTGITSVSRHR